MDEARPLRGAGAAAALLLLDCRPVDARHAKARPGQGDRVASEAAGGVEDCSRWLDPGKVRGRGRRRDRVEATKANRVRGRVDLVEELIPYLLAHQLTFFKTPSAWLVPRDRGRRIPRRLDGGSSLSIRGCSPPRRSLQVHLGERDLRWKRPLWPCRDPPHPFLECS